MLALRSQTSEYLHETFCRRALEYLQPARKKKKKEKNAVSYRNAWPLLTFLKACGRWAHVFATNASPRPWTKLVMPPCPTPTVHGGQYDTKYQVCDNRVDLCKQHL